MKDPTAERAARAADLIRIYEITRDTPGLPLPFAGPDRAAFYFIDREPAAAREAVESAGQVFTRAFGVTFGWHDEQAPNGMNRLFEAELRPSGLKVVLIARAEHMQDETEDAGELVAA